MNVSATARNARIAPRKVRALARLLRGMSARQAEIQLRYLPGRAVRDAILPVLHSAVANATDNFGLKAEELTVASVAINAGIAFKRFRPASRGMAHPFKKRTSHITVTVAGGEKRKEKRETRKEIVTISADEYVKSAAPLVAETSTSEAKPVEKDVPPSKEQEAFGKLRGLQGGGDKKKSFRRKSVG